MANPTPDDVYGYAQDLLKYEGEEIGLPALEEDRTLDWIRDLQQMFFEEFYGRRMTAPEYMKSHTGYDAVAETALAADVAAGAATFTVDSSSALDTSGCGVIYDDNHFDIFQHTGNSGGTVSGVPSTGPGKINFAHDEDDAVAKLYALPTDFSRPRPVRRHDDPMKKHDGVLIDGIGCREVPDMPQGLSFSLFQNSSGEWFLWMPRNTSGQITVIYDRKPTDPVIGTSLDVPSPYHWWIAWGLVALHKQALDEDYVPAKEQVEQEKIFLKAMAKRSAAKPVLGNAHFFGRYR